MDTAKRVSSGTTYLLRNGQKNSAYVAIKECNYIRYSVVSSVLVVYFFNSDIFCSLINSESSRNMSGQARSFPFYTPSYP